MTISLRRRLLIVLLCAVSGAWVFLATANYIDSRHEIGELLDAELLQSAMVLLALSEHELMEQRLTGPSTISIDDNMAAALGGLTHKYEKKLAFQVWIGDSTLALRSASAPRIHLSSITSGFSDQIIANQAWRIYSVQHKKVPILIQVGERYDVRGDLTEQIVRRMLSPMITTLPILALMIWYGVGFAMKPLNRLAREVATRAADYLSPVDHHQVPVEAQSLVHSLNALLARLQKAFESERRFTADAAHELRTPLAAIKAQAQVAQRTNIQQDQQRALQQVINAVDNATRVAQQLLTLARVDPAVPLAGLKKVDLSHLATTVIAELVPSAFKKHIDISLAEPSHGTVYGTSDALTILLTNLVDNAIHYTPENGTVVVGVTTHDEHVILSVSDSGPGIPADEREKVLERFYRGREVTQPGSGLGLSITQRIAELHQARIVMGESTLGGLLVEVIFPSPSVLHPA
jgi:two-component system, OmpR family, sensor kinase